MNIVRFVILCILYKSVATNDVVINSTVTPFWSAVIFTIPVEVPFFDPTLSFCKLKSIYYCLISFKNLADDMNPPAFEVKLRSTSSLLRGAYRYLWNMKEISYEQSQKIFGPFHKKHNYYVIQEQCCRGQFYHYFNNGFKFALMTPEEYFEKLTDYSEKSKYLNYLASYYDSECEVNIITKIGFGKGSLKRETYGYKYVIRR